MSFFLEKSDLAGDISVIESGLYLYTTVPYTVYTPYRYGLKKKLNKPNALVYVYRTMFIEQLV